MSALLALAALVVVADVARFNPGVVVLAVLFIFAPRFLAVLLLVGVLASCSGALENGRNKDPVS